jgi:predicted component of type VI protein secretion system
MKALLQVTSAQDTGRRVDLRDGQVAQFGRTEWADFAFRQDAAMAEVHFAVACRADGVFLKVLAGDRDTLVNGEKVTEAQLHSGDEITAGLTVFSVMVEGEAAPARDRNKNGGEARPPATDFVALCHFLTLDDALPAAKADPGQSRDDFLAKLLAAKLLPTAVRLYAHWLPKRAAVWWGCLAVRETCADQLPAEQLAAVAAAEKWVAQPDEPTRRQAEVAFERANYSGAGGMLAAAAFGAGDSLAPENAPEPVPPDARMTGHCVKTALVFASVAGDARQAPIRWPLFLTLAQDVMTEKIKLPGSE